MKMFNSDLIEKSICYKFKNKNLLKRAFTHSSYSKDNNERLEFLGDSVLQIIISKYLYNQYEFDEGLLTKYRAKIVCENNLNRAIVNLKLQEFLIVGDSYKDKPSKAMCADLCEAIIGAIFLDSNSLIKAEEFIFTNVKTSISIGDDYKTILQELVQSNKLTTKDIVYSTNQCSNENNIAMFESKVYVSNKLLGSGKGKTKKEAEQNSAKIAIEKIKLGDDK